MLQKEKVIFQIFNSYVEGKKKNIKHFCLSKILLIKCTMNKFEAIIMNKRHC